jgi:hypothetical protein
VDRAGRSSRVTIHRVGGVELSEHAAKLHSLGLGPAARSASSVPVFGAPEQDNKWPDGTRVMVRNKPKSWSEATIFYTRLDAEYWRPAPVARVSVGDTAGTENPPPPGNAATRSLEYQAI